MDNHAELVAAMTNLSNTIQAGTAMATHALRRIRQSVRNENVEGMEDSLGGVSRTLAAFLKVDPLIFNGSTNLTEADNWFQAVERALRTQQWEKLSNGGKESADYYTNKMWTLHRRYSRKLSTKKYLHESIREARELELLQLKQGSMTIAEYTSKFEELCRFSRISQGTPESFED
ncbi:uncharacterized protein LOC107611116 [Arachis ipaensis]|uniref:uncharacterized protein LOC107611116 n=1 Tax=Arachis ipaensis TaxID=130454 RepID=UPI0007AFCC8C|nr:uncharacterized protein LOC107611116 [Arachis ipaensis]